MNSLLLSLIQKKKRKNEPESQETSENGLQLRKKSRAILPMNDKTLNWRQKADQYYTDLFNRLSNAIKEDSDSPLSKQTLCSSLQFHHISKHNFSSLDTKLVDKKSLLHHLLPTAFPQSKGNDVSELDSLIASTLSLQHLCLPLDRLPQSFMYDILSRDLGDLFIFTVNDTDDMSQNNSNTSNFLEKRVVVAALFTVHMVNWSRIKDAEFSLRRICNIFSLFVAPQFQNFGLASALLDFGVQNAQHARCAEEVSLEVRASNKIGQSLYSKKGLSKQSDEDEYYEYGVDKVDRQAIDMATVTEQYIFSSSFQEHTTMFKNVKNSSSNDETA